MNVSGIDASYYTVADIAATTKFYTDLIGKPPDTEWEGRLSEWELSDGNAFGLYKSEGDGGAGHSGMVMFAVADVAQAVSAAKARGVHFHENGDVTDTPVCHMAFGQDNERNQFILHHRK